MPVKRRRRSLTPSTPNRGRRGSQSSSEETSSSTVSTEDHTLPVGKPKRETRRITAVTAAAVASASATAAIKPTTTASRKETKSQKESKATIKLTTDVALKRSLKALWVIQGWLLFLTWLYLSWFPSFFFVYLMAISLLGGGYVLYHVGLSTFMSETVLPIPEQLFGSSKAVQKARQLLAAQPFGPRSKATTTFLVSFAITVLALGAVFDSTFRLALWDSYQDVEFTRVGAVDSHFARVWVRYPPPASVLLQESNSITTNDAANVNTNTEYSLRLYLREKNGHRSAEWTEGSRVMLQSGSDWTGVGVLTNLTANTEYEYSWMLHYNGAISEVQFAQTGRRSGKDRGSLSKTYADDTSRFSFRTTAAAGEATQFSFVFGSCIKPNVPYGTGIRGFKAIAKYIPDFLLFLGDFIYVDVGVNFASTVEHYSRLYREVLGHKESVELLTKSPSMAMFDDHEILNDWDKGQSVFPYTVASVAFRNYLASGNPVQSSDNRTFYYTFTRGNNAFFVLDTRSFRQPRDKDGKELPLDDPHRTMLGTQQLAYLQTWLRMTQSHAYAFKFIVTSVPFTYGWTSPDSWFGYQHERQVILDFIHEHAIQNVIILSGDRHQVAVTEFEYLPARNAPHSLKNPVVEFSVSPINQFGVPLAWFSEVQNHADSVVSLPRSGWLRDRKVYYEHDVGKVQVGRIHVDTTVTPPRLVFCVFEEHPVNNQDRIDCGGEHGITDGKPNFRYEIKAEIPPTPKTSSYSSSTASASKPSKKEDGATWKLW